MWLRTRRTSSIPLATSPSFPAFNDADALAGLSRSALFLGDPPRPSCRRSTHTPRTSQSNSNPPHRHRRENISPRPRHGGPRPVFGDQKAPAGCSGGCFWTLLWYTVQLERARSRSCCALPGQEQSSRADVAVLALFTRTEWAAARLLVRQS